MIGQALSMVATLAIVFGPFGYVVFRDSRRLR